MPDEGGTKSQQRATADYTAGSQIHQEKRKGEGKGEGFELARGVSLQTSQAKC